MSPMMVAFGVSMVQHPHTPEYSSPKSVLLNPNRRNPNIPMIVFGETLFAMCGPNDGFSRFPYGRHVCRHTHIHPSTIAPTMCCLTPIVATTQLPKTLIFALGTSGDRRSPEVPTHPCVGTFGDRRSSIARGANTSMCWHLRRKEFESM